MVGLESLGLTVGLGSSTIKGFGAFVWIMIRLTMYEPLLI